jgi:hypothetical protein
MDHICLEDVYIDIRALTEGHPLYKWQYQQSNRLDENVRKAVLLRDHYACKMCGKQKCRLEVHHIQPRRLHGGDSIYNLITLCEMCHHSINGQELLFKELLYSLIAGKEVHTRDAQHVMQGKQYLRQELEKLAPLLLTTGGDTANRRIDWDIPKSHSNDAIVSTGLKVTSASCAIQDWTIKPMRRRTKAKIEEIEGFRHRDFVCYTKRNGERYFAYITALYPAKRQCNLTTTDGKILKRYGMKPLRLLWRFQHIYWFPTSHIERRTG